MHMDTKAARAAHGADVWQNIELFPLLHRLIGKFKKTHRESPCTPIVQHTYPCGMQKKRIRIPRGLEVYHMAFASYPLEEGYLLAGRYVIGPVRRVTDSGISYRAARKFPARRVSWTRFTARSVAPSWYALKIFMKVLMQFHTQ